MAEHVAGKDEVSKVVPTRDTIQTRSCQNMKGLSVSELCAGKSSHGPCKEMTAMSFLPLVTRFEMIQADTLCDVTSDSAWSERDIKQYNADRAYVASLKQDITEALYEDPSLLPMDDCCTNLEPMDFKDDIDTECVESNIEIPAEPPAEGSQIKVKTDEEISLPLDAPDSLDTEKEIFDPPFESSTYEHIPMPQCIPPEPSNSQLATVRKCLPQILKTSQPGQPMTVTVDRSNTVSQIIIHKRDPNWLELGEKIAQPIPVSLNELQKVEQQIPCPSNSTSISNALFSTAHFPSILPKTMEPPKAAEATKADTSTEFLQFVQDIQFVSKDSHGNESYKCTMCPKVYLSMNAFKAHASTHFKGTNTCGVCGKQFSRSWLLKGHMRTHTGERPFACTFEGCTKAFADRSNLRSHMLIHSAASGKGYRCEQCQRVFAQKRYLHKHMQEVCKVFPEDSR